MRRAHKYGAVRTDVDGISFASKKEARRYMELRLLERAGELHGLTLQPGFPLVVASPIAKALPVKVGEYRADFIYCTCLRTPCVRSHVVIEDAKGFKTPLYRWKKRHVEAQYGIEIREV